MLLRVRRTLLDLRDPLGVATAYFVGTPGDIVVKYFAYGSNMLARRLTDPSRAPSAVACGVAEVRGFVVRFHKIGRDGSGKCTLIDAGAEVAAIRRAVRGGGGRR